MFSMKFLTCLNSEQAAKSNKDDHHLRARNQLLQYKHDELMEKYKKLHDKCKKLETMLNIENEEDENTTNDDEIGINDDDDLKFESYGYYEFDWNDPLLTKYLTKRNGIQLHDSKNNTEKQKQEEEKEESDNPKLKLLKFADIKRIAGNGYRALSGGGGIILRDGKYPVYKFVHDIDPVFIVVPVTWKSSKHNVGYIQLDDHQQQKWDGSIPIIHATRSNVRFYGCYLDPSATDIDTPYIQCKDGGMFDFSYTKYYSNYIRDRDGQKGDGGCRLERHSFAHIETPLDREGYSGVFIIGKLIEEYAICLTAFIIARGQTLYVPPNTIHTNDYQRGTWRTYLEVGDIDICDIVRMEDDKKEKISLKFYCGITKKRMAQYELPTFKVNKNPNDPNSPSLNHRNGHDRSFTITKLTKGVSNENHNINAVNSPSLAPIIDGIEDDVDEEYYDGENKFVDNYAKEPDFLRHLSLQMFNKTQIQK